MIRLGFEKKFSTGWVVTPTETKTEEAASFVNFQNEWENEKISTGKGNFVWFGQMSCENDFLGLIKRNY